MIVPLLEAPTPNARRAVPLRFIVADDDRSISSLVVRVITSMYHGSVSIIAANGTDGLRAYDQHGADLIVTDRHMPEMDGLALIRAIRDQEIAIPILLTSGVPDGETKAAAADATHFLLKPFSIRQLSTALTALLPLPPLLMPVLPVLPASIALLPVLPNKMYHFIVADTRIWVQEALRYLILAAYPTANVRTVSTANAVLADYTQYGADLIILSRTLAPSVTLGTLARIHRASQTIPVIVFSTSSTLRASVVQSNITRFVNNPFPYEVLAGMIAKMHIA
jgi:DNA-binding NtrC family response regulator